MIIFILLGKLA